MPTLFCLKNIGEPSSIRIEIPTNKNNGDRVNKRINAKSLLSTLVNFKSF